MVEKYWISEKHSPQCMNEVKSTTMLRCQICLLNFCPGLKINLIGDSNPVLSSLIQYQEQGTEMWVASSILVARTFEEEGAFGLRVCKNQRHHVEHGGFGFSIRVNILDHLATTKVTFKLGVVAIDTTTCSRRTECCGVKLHLDLLS